MKNLFLLLFAGLFTFVTACESNTSSSEEAQEETTETSTETETEETSTTDFPSSGENYTNKVLDAEKASPRMEMTGNVAGVDVSINYGSPAVKGRTVFGDDPENSLVQYGEVWRTGANEATTIKFSSDVVVEGEALAAGTYALFTIPGADEWTVIFNRATDQWGSTDYNEEEDALRVKVSPMPKDETTENMDFMVDGNSIVLRWAKLAVPFQVAAAE